MSSVRSRYGLLTTLFCLRHCITSVLCSSVVLASVHFSCGEVCRRNPVYMIRGTAGVAAMGLYTLIVLGKRSLNPVFGRHDSL